MANLYRYPEGVTGATGDDPLLWVIARHVDVQAKLKEIAASRGEVASKKLASHRKKGHSFITVDKGDVDHYVNLYDADPDSSNALAIELGARNGRGGVHALGTAFPEIKHSTGP